MLCKLFQRFPLRHRGSPHHAGKDEGLAQAGQGVFRVQRGGSGTEAGHARRHIICDPQCVKPRHLFPDRAVKARVAGMQADSHKSLCLRFFDGGDHLLKRHFRAVEYTAIFFAALEQAGIDKAPGVDDLVGLRQVFRAAQGDEIRCAGSRADEMNHNDLRIKTKRRAHKSTPKADAAYASDHVLPVPADAAPLTHVSDLSPFAGLHSDRLAGHCTRFHVLLAAGGEKRCSFVRIIMIIA